MRNRIILVLLVFLLLTSNAYAALTKAVASLDDWTAVAQNTVVEGAIADVSPNYQTTLTIQIAATSVTASANGMEIRVQISSNTAGDEDWQELTSFQGTTGTAVKQDIADNPLNAGAIAISIAATASFTKPTGTDTGWRYIKDTAAIADSELVMQNDLTLNNHIDIVDGTTNTHQNTADLYNIAGVYVVTLPDSANRVRVIYNNCKDAAGATYDVRSRISKITGI